MFKVATTFSTQAVFRHAQQCQRKVYYVQSSFVPVFFVTLPPTFLRSVFALQRQARGVIGPLGDEANNMTARCGSLPTVHRTHLLLV